MGFVHIEIDAIAREGKIKPSGPFFQSLLTDHRGEEKQNREKMSPRI